MGASAIGLDPEQLRDQTLFRNLAAADLEVMAAGGCLVSEARGARIIGRGDRLDGMYTVFDGRLKLYMLSCNGDERVLRVLRPGESFGEAIMFNAIPSPVFVEALTQVELGYFPRQVIADALARLPNFTTSMLQGMSALMRELIQDLETCCLHSAMQRTVNYLLREAESSPPPHIAVELPAPKSVVASTLNISAETFSRELHRLQGESLIEIDRRTIYLRDREALAALLDGGPPAARSN